MTVQQTGPLSELDALTVLAKWSRVPVYEIRGDLPRAFTLAIRRSHPSGGGSVGAFFAVKEAGRVLGVRR